MKALALTVTSLLLAAAATAQENPCSFDQTIGDCFTKLISADEQTQQAKESATAATDEAVKDQPTGVDTDQLANTTKNFLPWLALSGLVGDGGESEGDGVMTIDFNPLLKPLFGEHKYVQLQAVVNSDPAVSGAVAMQLPEDQRENLTASLKRGLEGFDDVTYSLVINCEGRCGMRFGRNFASYRETYGALYTEAIAPQRALAVHRAQTEASSALQALASLLDSRFPGQSQTVANAGGSMTDQQFDQLQTGPMGGPMVAATAAEQQDVLDAVVKAANALIDFQTLYGRRVRELGLDRFAELVANQPQAYFEIKSQQRQPLVGVDETTYKLNFEYGFHNLNRATRAAACKPDNAGSFDTAGCVRAYSSYVAQNGAYIEGGWRFSFSGEYTDLSGDTVDLSSVGLAPLTFESQNKQSYALGLSGNWTPSGGDDSEPVRVDFEAKFDNAASSDELRRDRLTASLTFTRKVGGVTIPLGLVYANHSEFLGDVDGRLSTHVGIKYSFDSGS